MGLIFFLDSRFRSTFTEAGHVIWRWYLLDENGLELSLGLGFGGSSAKSKGKSGSSSDTRTEEGDRGNKLVDDFKNFLHEQCRCRCDAAINLNNRGLWVSSANRSAETDDEKRSDLEDCSTAENEDVAESEVEGSTSRLASHHDDGSKQFLGVGGPPEATKEIRGFSDSSVVELQGQRRLSGSSENDFKQGNLNYGVPFSVQPVSIMNGHSFPIKESNSVGAPSTSGHPITGMIQVLPPSNGEQRPGNQSVNPGSLPVMFGYSPVQLPTLDKDNSWGMVSHLQQLHSSYAGRAPSNAEKQNDGLKISQAMQAIARNSNEVAQVDGEDIGTGQRPKDAPERSTAETIYFEFFSHKARTISGVTYKYSANQIRIVCACHGSHMSPEEFVRHASEENANPDAGNGSATFPNVNPAASTQS
ncbi:AFP-like protein 2 [Salix purpurea]|uniref:Ninja-family protein n=2 Tax=Salix purpurea TaxID=77065 RepID=A0A9Q0UJX4_SALPP|nr:AFP-like protein 2 [Salix purpurea]